MRGNKKESGAQTSSCIFNHLPSPAKNSSVTRIPSAPPSILGNMPIHVRNLTLVDLIMSHNQCIQALSHSNSKVYKGSQQWENQVLLLVDIKPRYSLRLLPINAYIYQSI